MCVNEVCIICVFDILESKNSLWEAVSIVEITAVAVIEELFPCIRHYDSH